MLALFLRRLRPLGVTLVSVPLGFLATFLLLRAQGITLNVMALGGLAVAIGAMVDAAIVLIDRAQQRLDTLGPHADAQARWNAVRETAFDLGPTLFTSMAIITLSFLPIFALEGQEGRLFGPLAITKTWAMAASAVLCVTVLPILVGLFLRPRATAPNAEDRPPAAPAQPSGLLALSLRRPGGALVAGLLLSLSALYPALKMDSEFLPPSMKGICCTCPPLIRGYRRGLRPASFSKRTGS